MRTRRSTGSSLLPVNPLTEALRSFGRLFVDAGRVLVQHWPALVCLFLAGWAGRMGFLWLATVASNASPTVGVLLLPLAPMSTLLSMVLMLRVSATSLPAFRNLFDGMGLGARIRSDLTVAGQVLLPFLAVYASAGMLREDVRVFLYDSTADEWLNTNLQSIDFGRADYASGWGLAALVLGALAIRKIITVRELTKKHLAWAAVAVYVEVLWVMTLANQFTNNVEQLTDWVSSRRAVAFLFEAWEGFRAWLEGISDLALGFLDVIGGFLGSLGGILLVPVAWLAIGAAVYGHQLAGKALEVPTHEDVVRRIEKVPDPVRRAVAHVAEPVTTPIQSALTAIGKIAAAGILPMVLFCVVFLVANRIEFGMEAVLRAVVGPGEMWRQYALSPYVMMAQRCVSFIVTLALIGSAVNAVVVGQQRLQEAGASSSR